MEKPWACMTIRDCMMGLCREWCLTLSIAIGFSRDYTKENGAFCIVPGSHKLCRHPKPGEGVEDAIPVEAPAGSAIVFHGNVWHGAFPRLTPGIRLSVNTYYCGPAFPLSGKLSGPDH